MRSVLPRLAGGAIIAGILAVLAIGALGGELTQHGVADGGLPCPFLWATGVVCPLCGMTHATLALGAGNLGAAFSLHPLFWVVLAFALWGGYQLARGKDLSIAGRRLQLRTLLVATAVVWVVNVVAQSA